MKLPKFYSKSRQNVREKFDNINSDKKRKPWQRQARKHRSHTLLQIDYRLHDIKNSQAGKKLSQKQKMMRQFNYNGEQRSVNFFIPSLPVKRHPQLEKIETYFVSDYIDYD